MSSKTSEAAKSVTPVKRNAVVPFLVFSTALGLAVLLPTEPQPWLAGMSLRALPGLLLWILALQALGQWLLERMGADQSFVMAGLVSGFVSSMSTIMSMGKHARRAPKLTEACASAAVMSTAAAWVQALVILLLLWPSAALEFAPAAAAAVAIAIGGGAWLARRGGVRGRVNQRVQHPPFQLREILLLAGLLALVALACSLALHRLGWPGVLGAVALFSPGEPQAPIAALASLLATGQIDLDQLRHGVLLAIVCSSLGRSLAAVLSGGWAYARWVLMASAGSALAAGLALLA